MGDALIWVPPEADSETRISVIFGTLGKAWRSETGKGRQLTEYLSHYHCGQQELSPTGKTLESSVK